MFTSLFSVPHGWLDCAPSRNLPPAHRRTCQPLALRRHAVPPTLAPPAAVRHPTSARANRPLRRAAWPLRCERVDRDAAKESKSHMGPKTLKAAARATCPPWRSAGATALRARQPPPAPGGNRQPSPRRRTPLATTTQLQHTPSGRRCLPPDRSAHARPSAPAGRSTRRAPRHPRRPRRCGWRIGGAALSTLRRGVARARGLRRRSGRTSCRGSARCSCRRRSCQRLGPGARLAHGSIAAQTLAHRLAPRGQPTALCPLRAVGPTGGSTARHLTRRPHDLAGRRTSGRPSDKPSGAHAERPAGPQAIGRLVGRSVGRSVCQSPRRPGGRTSGRRGCRRSTDQYFCSPARKCAVVVCGCACVCFKDVLTRKHRTCCGCRLPPLNKSGSMPATIWQAEPPKDEGVHGHDS